MANSFNSRPQLGSENGLLRAIWGTCDSRLGSYAVASPSGVIAAGLSAGSPVFALQYTGSKLALVRRVRISAANNGTAFAAGTGIFNLFAARAFTVQDTGGTALTLTGNNGKLRTGFSAAAPFAAMIANTGALTAGTRTKDSTPLTSVIAGVLATAGVVVLGPTEMLRVKPGEQPLALASNEGFVIEATVPATGTWKLGVEVYLDEVDGQ